MLGYAVLTGLIAVGIGPLVSVLPSALLALTLVGAAYLIYLGVGVLLKPSLVADSDSAATSVTRGRFVMKGIGVSALNPKGLLVFLAILPQFARPTAPWPMTLQLAVLGGVFIAICGLFYLFLGFTATRVLGARPRVAALTSRIAGIAMILVGLSLIAERLIALAGRGWAVS
jgi:threonine/homoserine/homoserine lactone efflux protein